MGIPDVLGFTLEEASALLTKAGFYVSEIQIASSPRSKKDNGYDGNSRVIRVEVPDDQHVKLLLCNPHESE